MTTCRVCAHGRGARHTRDVRDAGSPDAGDAGAVLLVRAWRDGDVLRARLLAAGPSHRTVATAQGVDAVCDALRSWLSRL